MDSVENFDEDAGYPRSPGSDIPESTFSNSNRVRKRIFVELLIPRISKRGRRELVVQLALSSLSSFL